MFPHGFLPPGFVFADQRGGAPYPPPKGTEGKPYKRDYYDLLGARPDASTPDIRQAYRNKSKNHHPDKGGNHEFYQRLTHAYAVLSDPEKRACYDAYGEDFAEVPNIGLFVQQLRAEDIIAPVSLTLSECLSGKEVSVRYRADKDSAQVVMTHTFRVPAGVRANQKFTFHNIGNSRRGKLPGSLVVVVQEVPQESYQRVGPILLHKRKTTLAEALSGQPIPIVHPGLDAPIYISRNIFHPAEWYKVDCDDKFYVAFDIEFPETLTEAQQQAFRMPIEKDEHPVVTSVSVTSKQEIESALRAEKQEEAVASEGQGPAVQECRTQ